MLKSLKLTNFRCFSEHTIIFGTLNVAVGVNNAGKTTVAEALRIVSIACSRFKNITAYTYPPPWLFVPRRLFGFSFSLRNLQINFDNLIHRYGEPPAMIEADFGNRGKIRIYIAGENRVHCVVFDGRGIVAKTQNKARMIKIPKLETLPQVGPVLSEEKILMPEYIRGSLSSRLAPIHFRNQLNFLYNFFPEFQEAVEITWPGLSVLELIGQGDPPGRPLYLHIRDGDFVSEIFLMGHGLQMWLQTVWFLTRAEGSNTIILDEPDVYMHADLQRKLVRYVRSRFSQVIITTHSTEIMSEVSPDNIIVIDKTRRESTAADSLPAVQKVITNMGSAQNVHLTRLWKAKRFLLLEGKDLKILQAIQNTLYPNSTNPIDGLPNASIGGWGGWRYALGSSLALENAAGTEIKTYCILDSDYHCSDQFKELQENFSKRGVELHIWEMKEIENYLLVPSAIERAIITRSPKRAENPTFMEIENFLNSTAKGFRVTMFDGISQEILNFNRSLGSSGANKRARDCIKSKINKHGLIGAVSGKDVLSELFKWAKVEFGASLNTLFLAQILSANEISSELKFVLDSIENAESFRPQLFEY